MADITLPAVYLAGALSFLSPCVLPLVPPYLAFLAGTSVEALDGPTNRGVARRTLLTAAVFVLGFSTVFVALGAGASVIGATMRAWSPTLSIVAGVAIILMGLHFLGAFKLLPLMREVRFQVTAPAGPAGAYVMGLAFAFGWTPCIGPVLAGVLAVAGAEASVTRGAGLLALYSLGLGTGFLIAAAAMGPFSRFLKGFRRHLGLVEKTMGAALVLTGIGFLTGFIATASFWLLETFPALATLG